MSILLLLLGCSTESLSPSGSQPGSTLSISKSTGVVKPMTAPCDPTPYITSITLTDMNKNPIASCGGTILGNTNYYIKVSGKVSSFCLTLSSGGTIVSGSNPACRDNGFPVPYQPGDIGTVYIEILTPSTPTGIVGYVTPYDACAGAETPVNFNFGFVPGTTLTFTYNNGRFIVTSNYPVADNLSISGNIKAYSDSCLTMVGKDGIASNTMNACTTSFSSAPNPNMSCSAVNYKYTFAEVNGTTFSSNGVAIVNGHSYNVVVNWSCAPFSVLCY